MLSAAVRLLGSALVLGLAVVTLVQMLAGRVNMRGLFAVKGGADAGAASPARVQLLATTLIVSATYLQGVTSSGSIPDVPVQMLALFGASQVAYVGSKVWSAYRRKRGT